MGGDEIRWSTGQVKSTLAEEGTSGRTAQRNDDSCSQSPGSQVSALRTQSREKCWGFTLLRGSGSFQEWVTVILLPYGEAIFLCHQKIS